MRGGKTVVFPEDTILLPNATLTIQKERLGGGGYAWLMDQEHAVVASTISDTPHRALAVANIPAPAPVAQMPTAFVPAKEVAQAPEVVATPKASFIFADEVAVEEEPAEPTEEVLEIVPVQEEEKLSNEATVNQAQVPIPSENLPYYGLAGVLSLGILALYATRVK